jgi:RHS repeat-associated protein
VSLKRYRNSGKKRDEETGFAYNGARYYACWLARWSSADPSGLGDGPNLYQYVRGNPIILVDPNGKDGVDPQTAMVVALALRQAAGLAQGGAAIMPGAGVTAGSAATAAGAPVAIGGPSAALGGAIGGGFVTAMALTSLAMALTVQIHMQRSASIAMYGNPWGMSSNAIAFPTLRVVQQLWTQPYPIPQPVPLPQPGDPPLAPQLGRIYATYTKYNVNTGLYYSGRTSMVIDLNQPWRPQAEAAVEARDANHHKNDPDFEYAVLDSFAVGYAVNYDERYRDFAYAAIRGREQQLIDYFGQEEAYIQGVDFSGGAWTDSDPDPHLTENDVRGVAKDEVLGQAFHFASSLLFGEIAPYTGN